MTASDLARQQILASSSPGNVHSLRSIELLDGHQLLVKTVKGLASMRHLAEVCPIQADVAGRRVLDPRCSLENTV